MTITELQSTLFDMAQELNADYRRSWQSDHENSERFKFYSAELSTLARVSIEPESESDGVSSSA